VVNVSDQLKHLAQAYFHQDFDVDGASPSDVIKAFRDGEQQESVNELIAEIGNLLSSTTSESEIGGIWVHQYGASYEPDMDGMTYRDWLPEVQHILRGAKC
jgi:hypothetical protein